LGRRIHHAKKLPAVRGTTSRILIGLVGRCLGDEAALKSLPQGLKPASSLIELCAG
jgi:hypothetical protein